MLPSTISTLLLQYLNGLFGNVFFAFLVSIFFGDKIVNGASYNVLVRCCYPRGCSGDLPAHHLSGFGFIFYPLGKALHVRDGGF